MFKQDAENHLIGIIGSYVDKFIRAGNHVFVQLYKRTGQILSTPEDDTLFLRFAGYNVSKTDTPSIRIDQSLYEKYLKDISPSPTSAKLKSR